MVINFADNREKREIRVNETIFRRLFPNQICSLKRVTSCTSTYAHNNHAKHNVTIIGKRVEDKKLVKLNVSFMHSLY